MPTVNTKQYTGADKMHIASMAQDLKMRGEPLRDLTKQYGVSEHTLNIWMENYKDLMMALRGAV